MNEQKQRTQRRRLRRPSHWVCVLCFCSFIFAPPWMISEPHSTPKKWPRRCRSKNSCSDAQRGKANCGQAACGTVHAQKSSPGRHVVRVRKQTIAPTSRPLPARHDYRIRGSRNRPPPATAPRNPPRPQRDAAPQRWPPDRQTRGGRASAARSPEGL